MRHLCVSLVTEVLATSVKCDTPDRSCSKWRALCFYMLIGLQSHSLHNCVERIEARKMNFLQRTRLLGILFIVFLVLWYKLNFSDSLSLEKNGKRLLPSRTFHARKAQVGIPFNVHLFLSLDYLNETIAMLFETANTTNSNDVTAHFCSAVNSQVGACGKLYARTWDLIQWFRAHLTLSVFPVFSRIETRAVKWQPSCLQRCFGTSINSNIIGDI